MLYLSIFNVLALLRLAKKQAASRADAPYVLLLVALFLFSAFRFEVGCDWTGYYFQWLRQKYGGDPVNREQLWWLMMSGIQSLRLSYLWLNVASATIFFFGAHVIARRQPDRIAFLILLFPILIVNMPMSGIRQGAAIGIMCIAFIAFSDRKLLHFVALTIVATLFHSSAMIFLLLAPMVWGGFTKNNLVASAILAVPGILLLSNTDQAELATSRYVDTGVDAFGAYFRVGLLFLTGVFYFAYLSPIWLRRFPQDFKLASLGALMMLALLAIVPFSSVIGDRFGYYLIPIQAAILARIPFLPLGKSSAIVSAAPYLVLALVFTVWTLNSRHFQSCYLPYQTWLFGIPKSRIPWMRY